MSSKKGNIHETTVYQSQSASKHDHLYPLDLSLRRVHLIQKRSAFRRWHKQNIIRSGKIAGSI